MATSRTGTSKYKTNREQVIAAAKSDGLTYCPGYQHGDKQIDCGRLLDYDNPQTEASAEADHIVPAHCGGTDDIDNLRVLCRACNLARNRKQPPEAIPDANLFPTIFAW